MAPMVFKDVKLQGQLDEKGFVKVPFWDATTVTMVREKYNSCFRSRHVSKKYFHTTYETTDLRLIDEVRAFLQPLFLERATALFSEMAPISAAYLVKESNPSSAASLHQDASFVDEPIHRSVSVWVALEDINMDNGCLQFVTGSHRLFSAIRSIPYTNVHIEQYNALLQPCLTNHSIQKGEAFIFYNAVVHASPPNTTGAERVVAVMGFYSQRAQLSLYLKNESNQCIDRYSITPEQLSDINGTFVPQAQQFIDAHPFPKPLGETDVKTFIRNNYPFSKRLSLWFKGVFFNGLTAKNKQ